MACFVIVCSSYLILWLCFEIVHFLGVFTLVGGGGGGGGGG